jgi:hypothetical protein
MNEPERNEQNRNNQYFIEQHMYENRASRFRPILNFIFMTLFGIGSAAFGVYIYWDLATWERVGGTKSMDSRLALLYDLGGKNAVAGFFFVVAALLIFAGIATWRRSKQHDKNPS